MNQSTRLSSFTASLMAALAIITLPPLVSATIVIATVIALFALIAPFSLLAVTLVIAPMRTLIATEGSGQFPADVGQMALIVFIGVWMLDYLLRTRQLPRVTLTIVFVPVGFFASIAALTSLSSVSLTAWVSETFKWVQILILIVLVLDLSRRYHWQWVAFVLTAAGTANALIGLYEFLGGSGALHLLINNRYFRAFGTFGQPNPFGAFMGLLAPIAIMSTVAQLLRLWGRWRTRQPIRLHHVITLLYFGLGAGLLSVGVFISWSRGAWLGFAASLVVMALSFPRRLWQSIVLLFAGVGMVMGAWFTDLIPQPIEARLTSIVAGIFTIDDVRGVSITDANYAVIERLAHWQAAVRMANDNPWLGVGMGNYEVAYADYRLINWVDPLGHAHNYYLNILAEGGMIGGIAYLAMWLMVTYLTWRTCRHPDIFARCVAVGLLGTWTYLAVHSLTDNLYVNNMFLHIGIMLGLLAVLHREAIGYTRLEH